MLASLRLLAPEIFFFFFLLCRNYDLVGFFFNDFSFCDFFFLVVEGVIDGHTYYSFIRYIDADFDFYVFSHPLLHDTIRT